jgi:UDP-N-acetylmuramate: L-alanyl-gamma-D-glutamyl-meso-diaminopimelate ligase
MRMGVHAAQLAGSLALADHVWVYAPPGLAWDPARTLRDLGARLHLCGTVQELVDQVAAQGISGDSVLVMSNGGFEGVHQRLLDALGGSAPPA